MPNKIVDIASDEEEEDHRQETISSRTRKTPKGHFVVYVGIEMTRFVLPTRFLKNPSFQKLLDKAEEEFGFGDAHRNKIVLPCDVSSFRNLLSLLSSDNH